MSLQTRNDCHARTLRSAGRTPQQKTWLNNGSQISLRVKGTERSSFRFRFGGTNEADLKHGAQRILLPQLLGNPPLLQPKHGCPRELHLAARGGMDRTHAEVAEGRARMGATAFPSAHDVVAVS